MNEILRLMSVEIKAVRRWNFIVKVLSDIIEKLETMKEKAEANRDEHKEKYISIIESKTF